MHKWLSGVLTTERQATLDEEFTFDGIGGVETPADPKKERITIRLDAEVLQWFRTKARGGGSYQALINDALQAYIAQSDTFLEDLIRRVVREEIERAL